MLLLGGNTSFWGPKKVLFTVISEELWGIVRHDTVKQKKECFFANSIIYSNSIIELCRIIIVLQSSNVDLHVHLAKLLRSNTQMQQNTNYKQFILIYNRLYNHYWERTSFIICLSATFDHVTEWVLAKTSALVYYCMLRYVKKLYTVFFPYRNWKFIKSLSITHPHFASCPIKQISKQKWIF